MEEHIIISDSKKTCLLLKMGGSIDDLYKLEAITDSRLVNLNVQRLQVLTQMPVIQNTSI